VPASKYGQTVALDRPSNAAIHAFITSLLLPPDTEIEERDKESLIQLLVDSADSKSLISHGECNLAMSYMRHKNTLAQPCAYMAVSKLCCFQCGQFFSQYNAFVKQHPEQGLVPLFTKGSRKAVTPWCLPGRMPPDLSEFILVGIRREVASLFHARLAEDARGRRALQSTAAPDSPDEVGMCMLSDCHLS